MNSLPTLPQTFRPFPPIAPHAEHLRQEFELLAHLIHPEEDLHYDAAQRIYTHTKIHFAFSMFVMMREPHTFFNTEIGQDPLTKAGIRVIPGHLEQIEQAVA